MRDQTKAAIERIHRKAFDFAAEDVVTYVAPDGSETELVALGWTKSKSESPEGVEIDQAGIREGETMDLLFHAGYLREREVELDAAGHFVIAGDRWDIREGPAVITRTGPIAGAHPLVQVSVRRAMELGASVAGSEFHFGD